MLTSKETACEGSWYILITPTELLTSEVRSASWGRGVHEVIFFHLHQSERSIHDTNLLGCGIFSNEILPSNSVQIEPNHL